MPSACCCFIPVKDVKFKLFRYVRLKSGDGDSCSFLVERGNASVKYNFVVLASKPLDITPIENVPHMFSRVCMAG